MCPVYRPPHQPGFAARSDADVQRLVDAYPLAWIVSVRAIGTSATALPLLPDVDGEGRIVSLTGHFAARNPHVAWLRENPRAVVLFNGPQGYISPEYVPHRRWAPTWNYAVAHFDVDIEFLPDEGPAALERLVSRMERDRAQPWTTAAMGERFAQLVPRILAFRAHVLTGQATFKLGQDEERSTLQEIVRRVPDRDLAHWMQDFNP